MPKVVDPVERRQQIFEAVFAVITEHGVEQASLRRVAEAAGLAIGSVRHYFDSQSELLAGAVAELLNRVTARLERHRERLEDAQDRLRIAEDMLCELLPLEPVSARECVVYVEFLLAARTNPAIAEHADTMFAGTYALAALLVGHAGLFTAELAEVEAQRLAALVDGLCVRAVLHPRALPPATARAAIRRHLEQLRERR